MNFRAADRWPVAQAFNLRVLLYHVETRRLKD